MKIDFFENLHVAEITGRQIGGHKTYGFRSTANLVAMCTYEFEYIRVLLVRHYAGTGGQFLGKLHEAEVLAVEEAAVRGQAAERLCHA